MSAQTQAAELLSLINAYDGDSNDPWGDVIQFYDHYDADATEARADAPMSTAAVCDDGSRTWTIEG